MLRNDCLVCYIRCALKFPNHSARISYCDAVLGNRFCDDAAGANCSTVTDSYAGEYNCATSNPDVAAYFHGCGTRFPKGAVFGQAFGGVGRVEYSVDMYSGAYSREVANIDAIAIQEDAVHIDFDISAEVYVFAVIDKERSGNPYVLTSRADEFIENGIYSFVVGRVGGIEKLLEIFCFVPAL